MWIPFRIIQALAAKRRRRAIKLAQGVLSSAQLRALRASELSFLFS
jgi:hypothetical protein